MTQQLFHIELPKLYYTAGEVVTGKIVYTPKADRNIHGIHIHFTGYEFCENTMLSDVPFQKKWILDGATTVFGNKCVINRGGHQTHTHKYSEAEGVTIKAGNYSWPFSFQIPKNIPPSCEYRAGKVKIDYTIAALVDIPWAKSIRAVQHLRVGLPYVTDPDRPKSTFKNEKSFIIHSHNTTGVGKHVLHMEAYVDRPVTYTGDKLTVFLKVNNNSGRNVQSIKVKLKQIWSYGTGYFEKYTITKVKHKDRKFPLAEGEYKTEVPMVVPNCDLRPTIQNASLIRVSYHITVIASVRAGADLRVRIPIIMASYPPVNKNIAVTPKALRKSKRSAEKKEEEKEEEPAKIEPVLIDWDAPVPGQQPNDMDLLAANPLMPNFVPTTQYATMSPNMSIKPTIEPTDFFIESFDPRTSFDAFEEVKPSQQSIDEMDFNSRLALVSEAVNEMDSAIQWAASGQLEHAVEVDPQMNADKAQAALSASAKNLADALAKLLAAAKKQSGDEFTKAVADVSGQVGQLSHAAKEAAYQLADPQFQQAVLQSTKAIALGSQQLFLQGKEIVNYDPFTSAYSLEFMTSTMEATSKNVQENCTNLASYTEQAYAAAASRSSQLLEAKANLEKIMAAFANPFGDINEKSTLEDVEKIAQQFAGIVSQFVVACHGSSSDIIQGAQSLISVLHGLAQNVKGTAKSHPLVGQQLMDNVKRAIAATQGLLDAAAVALKQGNVTNPQNVEKELTAAAKENHQKASNIISIIRAEQQRVIQEMKEEARKKEEQERARKAAEQREKEKFELEDRAEQELTKAAQAIALAADKLREALKRPKEEEVDPFVAHQVDLNSDVIDASTSVAVAIAELLKAASLAQGERARLARDTRPDTPYHRDPAWTEGLISAARTVVSLIEQLVAAVGGELEEEVIISLARAITAATAQLMSAERAKGDTDSEAHKRLTAAAKVVARTTTELVQKMKEAAEHKAEPRVEPTPGKSDQSATEARAKELEAAIKIAKLEKELEKARLEQLKIRQDKYKS